MALGHAAGIALTLSGVSLPRTLLLAVLAPTLFLLFRRPWPHGALLVSVLAGCLAGSASERSESRDCRLHLPEVWEGEVVGRFLTRPIESSSLPFRIEGGAPNGCEAVVRALLPPGSHLPRAGTRIRMPVRWEGRDYPRPGLGEWSGRLRATGDWSVVGGGGVIGGALALRGGIQHRIAQLWGEDSAPMVEAIVLARREHLDPEVREAFALSGTAHLLAISGFHVGVVAGLLLGLLRLGRLGPRRCEAGAVAGCWLYVLGIGAPDAAVRAALLLTLLVGARLRGQPVVAAGALGTAFLLLLCIDPGWLSSIGFQLSFAGTAGLVFIRKPLSGAVDRAWRRITRMPPPRRRDDLGSRLVKGGTDGLGVGIAATLPTLPLLAWHFDRFSLLGIPLTLAVAPIVATAIPGVGASLLLSLLPGGLGGFLAGGTDVLLGGTRRLVVGSASLPGASLWVSRQELVVGMFAGLATHVLLGRIRPGRIRAPVRRTGASGVAATLLLLLPLFPRGGALEVHVVDVGQGDAVALRYPSGSWILIDTGPRSPWFDAGERRVVPYLRRHGVRTLEAVVLTHPHLDHIGGAPAVFSALGVRGVLDPSRAQGSRPYLEVMEAASEAGIWWWQGIEGRSFDRDGVRVEILHPDSATLADPVLTDPNDLSIVLLVQWGDAAVLLTGDAPVEVERRILDRLPRLAVLKVGHHGSRTSTSMELLERTDPRMAVIPVGDGNQFGHPHPLVSDRLARVEVPVYRSDRDGDVRFRIRRDGSVEARSAR